MFDRNGFRNRDFTSIFWHFIRSSRLGICLLRPRRFGYDLVCFVANFCLRFAARPSANWSGRTGFIWILHAEWWRRWPRPCGKMQISRIFNLNRWSRNISSFFPPELTSTLESSVKIWTILGHYGSSHLQQLRLVHALGWAAHLYETHFTLQYQRGEYLKLKSMVIRLYTWLYDYLNG